MSQADYLNEMGISTWVLKNEVESKEAGEPNPVQAQPKGSNPAAAPTEMTQSYSENQEVVWTFVVDQLSGDAALLFDKILASLMLSSCNSSKAGIKTQYPSNESGFSSSTDN